MSTTVGIDVGVGSVKVVSFSREGDAVILDEIGEGKTPQGDWIKGDDKGKALEEVAKSIKSILGDLKSKAKQVVTCLPEDEVISRLVRLPPLKENEIRDALKFEAETFIPYPLDEVSIDYEIIETDEAGRLTVFAIAARNDLIQAYVKLFKAVGLELVALESPAVSMRRVVNTVVEANRSVLVIDIGEKYSDLVALNNGNVRFTRSLSVGGESITRAISINLGLDMQSAEEYKKAYGMKELELEGKIKAAILPVFGSMSEEVRRAMALFREENNKGVDLLMLSGGGANMPGFAEELTKLLGVEVQVIQPFLKINTGKITVPINLNSDGCRFSLAVGSALRGLV